LIEKIAFRLFRLFGIDVKIHASFFLLPAAISYLYTHAYGFEIGLRAVVLVVMVFACVLAHEFSHSLKAKSYGIHVTDITLYAIGGVASMQRIPREPRLEFLIAIAGPLFNFALALILLVPLYFLFGKQALLAPSLESWPQTFVNLFWANIVLGLFNLVPAFPMDGGRILRSLLARRMGFANATRISVYLGYGFAILFVLIGLWKRRWMLILIALTVYYSASLEYNQVRYERFMKKSEGQ